MIPVNEPVIGQKEIQYVNECLTTGWVSSAGHFIEEFEEKWAHYCGAKYAIAVSNGTVALQMAIECLELDPGDEVIIPTSTIISCAQAVIYNRCVPVLVDADLSTWCMNVDQIIEKITPKTRAIMPVHIFGHPVDMDKVMNLAHEYNLKVIEDAAEAHGAEYLSGRDTSAQYWQRCGGIGHISAFSFYANKIITTGEGGMVLTNDQVAAEKLRKLRNLCFVQERRFYHTELGHNFRMTNMQAALGVGQFERISEIIEKKRWIGNAYNARFSGIDGLQLPIEREWAKSVYWMYGIVLEERNGIDATEFAVRLKELGVETRPFFLGMHEQPVFRNMGLFHNEKYPVAEHIARYGLYLPSGLTLTDKIINTIADMVITILQEFV